MQFDGADIIARPFPTDFKATAEAAISETTGYKVNLVGGRHDFPIDRIICDAAAYDRYTHRPQKSILY